ncbi:PRD domain-containing protein [Macrococcus animalis]|uniref:PRD domain-containing protein n=1 Tax=Macrococcus animalis TaxID=3395467 RepID=UPI0039BE8A53
MIKIKKVLNTSVVLVENEERKEFILFGKGIGFGKKTGQIIEENIADQTFMPVENNRVKEFISILDDISPEIVDITQEIVHFAGQKLNSDMNNSLYFNLMDHINFAVERYHKNINITNRVFWEIKSYYSTEFSVGEFAVEKINQTLNIELPIEEAANIAFHIINANGQNIDNKNAMKQAKLVGSIVNLVKYTLKLDAKSESIHYTRFITHVKFFVERFFADKMLEADDDILFKQIETSYPEAMKGAVIIKNYINQTYEKEISNDELTYLAVHIHRLMKQN